MQTPDNPYQPGERVLPALPVVPVASDRLPVFSVAMLVSDLVFCGLRAVMVLLGVVGFVMLRGSGHPMEKTVLPEVATGLLIAIPGIAANILLLTRYRVGIPFAVLALVGAAGSMVVGILQVQIQLQEVVEVSSPMGRFTMIGTVVGTTVRLAHNSLYIAALVRARRSGTLR
jgi:hypothetical protein